MRADDPLHDLNGGSLLAWYDAHRRDLPWRRTSDPYAVWVSEIMLQQTQVATVIPYWERWMARFPTPSVLASADEQDVLSVWQGLGYYRRCRLLQEGARWVAVHGTPSSVAEWRAVPGIGPYTAGAIASISQGLPAPLVDGNVERVYARLTGDSSSGPALNKAAWKWAERELFRARPGDWNQALMELGATVCRPVDPLCSSCPLANRCVARQTWRVNELPSRVAAKATVPLHQSVWVPVFDGRLGVRQISVGQWWEGMWEFPRADSEESLASLLGDGWRESLGHIRHSVTHHRIRLDVSLVRVETQVAGLRWLIPLELEALPMPSPQRRIVKLALPYL